MVCRVQWEGSDVTVTVGRFSGAGLDEWVGVFLEREKSGSGLELETMIEDVETGQSRISGVNRN